METLKTPIRVDKQTTKVTKQTSHSKQPVRIGELLKGFEKISSHPQRNEILKAIFGGIDFDPYA